MKYKNTFILFFYLLISLSITILILGINNLGVTNTSWLAAHDASTDIISWKFFRDDVWRFPLGSNPNYGMNLGSGIAFSGSIPIMSLIFKFFKFILPDEFHYFSLWILICFFLNGYISFLIISDKTKNITFSLIGSLFFILSPILINRLGFHLSLCAHWLILMGFYLELKENIIFKKVLWALLISISCLIHFYFTVMLLIIFISFLTKNFETKNFKNIFIIFGSLIFTMYIIGYFHVPFSDALAYGYGNYSLDLASFFINKSSVVNGSVNWSAFINNKTDIRSEGFGYLGLGGIIFLSYLVFNFLYKFKIEIKDKNFTPYIFITLICFLIAISNKIYLFNNLIFEIEIPKIFYGLLSVVRASGRIIWPVYYLIFIFAIFKIYKNFPRKQSISILIILFLLQVSDIYPGIKSHFFSEAFVKEKKLNDIIFWEKIAKTNPVLRTTYQDNQSKFLHNLRNVLLLKDIKKTDISIHGRYNRKLASITRSNLYNQFNEKIMPSETIFAIDNHNHLRNLYFNFKNENVGFFYKDKNWIAINGYRDEMTDKEFKMLDNFLPKIIKSNKNYDFNFKNQESPHGFGWTHNFGENQSGIWSEGNISNILFRLDSEIVDNFKIKLKINSIITKNNNPIIFEIYINENFYEKFSIKDINDLKDKYLVLDLNKDNFKEDTVLIKIKIKNPVTKLELLKSPDARRLGILIESIKVENLNL